MSVFVTLGIRHAMRIVICGLSGSTVFFFFQNFSLNGTTFRGGGGFMNIKWVFWFPLQSLSETFLILRRNEPNMIWYIYFQIVVILLKLLPLKSPKFRFDMIYLLTEIGLSPGGSSTVHIYTQTIHRTTQNKQYIEQHNKIGRVRAVPRLG